jgi:hypothetical protein
MNKIVMIILCLVIFNQTQGMEKEQNNNIDWLRSTVVMMCSIPTHQEAYDHEVSTNRQSDKVKEVKLKEPIIFKGAVIKGSIGQPLPIQSASSRLINFPDLQKAFAIHTARDGIDCSTITDLQKIEDLQIENYTISLHSLGLQMFTSENNSYYLKDSTEPHLLFPIRGIEIVNNYKSKIEKSEQNSNSLNYDGLEDLPLFTKNVTFAERYSKLITNPLWLKEHGCYGISSSASSLGTNIWWQKRKSLYEKRGDEKEIKAFCIQTNEKTMCISLALLTDIVLFIDKQNQFYIEMKDDKKPSFMPIEGMEIIRLSTTETSS